MNNIFFKASRAKLRFNHKGICTVEDLWDLPLESLDLIFKELNAKLKLQEEESLLGKHIQKDDESLSLKIAIVKQVFDILLLEQEERKNEAAKNNKKQELLKILEEKQNLELRNMSVDELKKLIDEL